MYYSNNTRCKPRTNLEVTRWDLAGEGVGGVVSSGKVELLATRKI